MPKSALLATLLAAAAALAGCRSNPLGFGNEGGSYEAPDVVVPAGAGGAAPVPVELPCPGRLVVYAADIKVVPNCNNIGMVLPVLLGNAAAKAGNYAVNSVTCKEPCTKQISLIWLGWDCGGNNPVTAIAAVEFLVECVLPGRPPPGDVSP